MLSLAAGHISNSYSVYNCDYIIQVFLVLRLFRYMQIHIIQVHTYYSSLSYNLKKYNISITYLVHVHL